MKSTKRAILSLLTVFCVAVLLPGFLTYLYFRFHIIRSELCFVTTSSSPFHTRSPWNTYPFTTLLQPTDRSDTSIEGATSTGTIESFHGIYVPSQRNWIQAHSYSLYNPYFSQYSLLGTLQSLTHLRKNPSAASMAMTLQTSFVNRKRETLRNDGIARPQILFYRDVDKWCFMDVSPTIKEKDPKKFCSQPLESYRTRTIEHEREIDSFPFREFIELYDDSIAVGTVLIHCPASNAYSFTKQNNPNGVGKSDAKSYLLNFLFNTDRVGSTGIHRNPNRQNNHPSKHRDNPFLEMILFHPATSLFLFINTTFAIIYYMFGVIPSDVSINYSKIVHSHEWWRCFSGTMAHFEPLHLMLNMMSLYALGRELEDPNYYSSIVFLWCNFCLIIWTSLFMMVFEYVKLKIIDSLHGSSSNRSILYNVNTVGYSGVLFAWMVVSSLERGDTCPIPFFPDLCFMTHEFAGGRVKWNFGPVVSLIVCQVLIPRASFVGHLAGIVCGFILHWNFLPIEIFWCPEVVLPLMIVINWWKSRRIASWKHGIHWDRFQSSDTSRFDGNVFEIESHGASHISNRPKEIARQRKLRFIAATQRVMAVLTVLSLMMYDVFANIFLSQLLVTIMLHYSVKMYREFLSSRTPRSLQSTTSVSAIVIPIGEGLIATFLVLLVSNGMLVGSCMGAWVHFSSEYVFRFGLFPSLLHMGVMTALNYIGLCLSSSLLLDSVDVGLFRISPAYAWIIRLSHSGLETLLANAAQFVPFQGQGHSMSHSNV